MGLTEVDIDALRRAVEWGKRYQKSEPQITVLPSPLPPEDTPQWVEVATRVAVMAQAVTLGLRPWQADRATCMMMESSTTVTAAGRAKSCCGGS
jgi:hypothetical protein